MIGAALVAVAAVGSPFGLTASPPVVHAAPGHTAQVRIWDTGTAPLEATITIEPVSKVNGKCAVSNQVVQDVTLASPAKVHLNPGQSATATVRVGAAAPAQDLAVVFSAAAGGSGGNVSVTGAVGTQLLVDGKQAPTVGCSAKATPAASESAAAAGAVVAASRGGSSVLWGWIVGALAAGAVLSAAVSRLFRRGRRENTPGS